MFSTLSMHNSENQNKGKSVHTYLGDTVDSVPNHCNKANNTIKSFT